MSAPLARRLRAAALAALSLSCLGQALVAQDQPGADADAHARPDAAADTLADTGTGMAADPAAEADADAAAEDPAFVAAPFATSSPGFGNGAGIMSMVFYRPDEDDTVSPTSSLLGLATYSDTGSWFLGLFDKNYLDDDRLRVNAGLVGGRIRSDLDVGPFESAEFDTDIRGVFVKAQRRVDTSDWFVGATASVISSEYTARNAAAAAYFAAFDVTDESDGAVGVVATYDSRDDQRYPTDGMLAELDLSAHPESLGSSEGYQALQLTSNWYREAAPEHVLAARVLGRFTPRDTPYAGLSRLGQRSDLRGYTPGENVAENLIATQAEWRWMFADRFGAVGFGGVAGLYDGGLSNLDSKGVFWSGGVGLRYTLSVENRLNLRLDFAWAEDDESGLYFSMGEAF